MTSWAMTLAALAPRWWAALNYVSAAGVITLGASSGSAHGSARVALILAAAAVGVVQVVAAQRRIRANKHIAEETRKITNNAMSNAFTPLLGLLAEIVGTRDTAEQARLRSQLRTSVAYAASLAIGPDQGVRSCVFEVDDITSPSMLRWSRTYAGRSDEPKSTFRLGTVRGDLAFAMLRDDTFAFCRDTESSPPPGWEDEHPHAYRTFLAVPVHGNGRRLGMLTVDSLTADDLEPDRDKPILDVLAHILAVSTVQEYA